MSRASERIEVYDFRERKIKLAMKHLRTSRDLLHAHGSDREPLNLPVSVSYQDLLDSVLTTALDIVEALPDDFFQEHPVGDWFGLTTALGGDPSEKYSSSDTPLEEAEKLVAAINERRARGKRQRTIERLENTDGRLPEEAALYRAKAEQMRRGSS